MDEALRTTTPVNASAKERRMVSLTCRLELGGLLIRKWWTASSSRSSFFLFFSHSHIHSNERLSKNLTVRP